MFLMEPGRKPEQPRAKRIMWIKEGEAADQRLLDDVAEVTILFLRRERGEASEAVLPVNDGARQEQVDLQPSRVRMRVAKDWRSTWCRNAGIASVQNCRDDASCFGPPRARVECGDIDLMFGKACGQR
ncbi:hypothetical protein [Paracoccus nototheniae]|uniref:Uncharacterized protein n=1 Tax=Paracoccus nototheniae TaxID=2489002 RepID=A0ABW4DRY2_9RHOB|nr:hypothetical protein [Paracoccus nototheniae]